MSHEIVMEKELKRLEDIELTPLLYTHSYHPQTHCKTELHSHGLQVPAIS